jgi:nucleotide-binding universal stress UspA family protein
VVAPIDFSSASIEALKTAGRIAYGGDAELTLLHVYPYGCEVDPTEAPYVPRVARMSAQAREAAISGLSRLAGRIRPAVSRIRIVVREGDPSAEILDFAERHDADLVAMGAHGRRGFDRLVLGSVTERVLPRAPCAVLTARDGVSARGARAAALTKIVCAVDLGTGSVPTIEAALALAQATGSSLTIAHVVAASRAEDERRNAPPHEPEYLASGDEAHQRLRRLAQTACDPGTDVDVVVAHGRRCAEIERVVALTGAGILVIGAPSAPDGDRAPLGATAQHFLRQAPCPIVVAHVRDRPRIRAVVRGRASLEA